MAAAGSGARRLLGVAVVVALACRPWAFELGSPRGVDLGGQAACAYETRWTLVQALHRAIDAFLARSLCRLDGGALCRRGRDGRPFAAGRGGFGGSDGEWAVSGHTGESPAHTRFLFDAAFRREPRRICEVGFNVGHSAATLLTAAGPNASYLGFDWPRLNPGVNEELFEMLQVWLGKDVGERLEMRWGDSANTIPAYLADCLGGGGSCPPCDLLFYDGAHDALSVLKGLSVLRRLAGGKSASLIVLDDVRCGGPLCGHSALAWDFLVWAGQVQELRCQSARSAHAAAPGHDFGACVGRFRWGARAAACAVFDARCVARTYREGEDTATVAPSLASAWARCCVGGADFELGPSSVLVGA